MLRDTGKNKLLYPNIQSAWTKWHVHCDSLWEGRNLISQLLLANFRPSTESSIILAHHLRGVVGWASRALQSAQTRTSAHDVLRFYCTGMKISGPNVALDLVLVATFSQFSIKCAWRLQCIMLLQRDCNNKVNHLLSTGVVSSSPSRSM